MSEAQEFFEVKPVDTEILIIGGGIVGLATAYNLAKLGQKNITIVEQNYINSGASGRNGGGVRMQFSTKTNIELMKESISICSNFAKEMGIQVWFRQGGYLFIAENDEQQQLLEQNIVLQNECNVPTRLLAVSEALQIVPQLEKKNIKAAAYNPKDGVVFPWPFLWGYLSKAKELGVSVFTDHEVYQFDIQADKITHVYIKDKKNNVTKVLKPQIVINAAGAWSPQIAQIAKVSLPNKPFRHEIFVTESLRSFLSPLVSVLSTGFYISQSLRGELVGGISDKHEQSNLTMESSLRFLLRMSYHFCKLFPSLADIKVIRQWAGCYDVTPDHNPILGFVDDIVNFFQINGFVGHGFMMAPIISKLCAEYIVKAQKHAVFEEYALSRFKENRANQEKMIIG